MIFRNLWKQDFLSKTGKKKQLKKSSCAYLNFAAESSLPCTWYIVRIDSIVKENRFLCSIAKNGLPSWKWVKIIEEKVFLHASIYKCFVLVNTPLINYVIFMWNYYVWMSVQDCSHKAVRTSRISNEHKEGFHSFVELIKVEFIIWKASRNAVMVPCYWADRKVTCDVRKNNRNFEWYK